MTTKVNVYQRRTYFLNGDVDNVNPPWKWTSNQITKPTTLALLYTSKLNVFWKETKLSELHIKIVICMFVFFHTKRKFFKYFSRVFLLGPFGCEIIFTNANSQCYFVHKHINNVWYNSAHSLMGTPCLTIIASNVEIRSPYANCPDNFR